MMLLSCCCLLALLTCSVEAKSSKQYYLPGKYCGNSPKEIDGAVVYSSDNSLYADSGCALKFRADDSMFSTKRIMIHFESLTISSCDGDIRLSVYFDSNSHGTPDYVYNCQTSTPRVLYSTGRDVTLRLDKKTTRGYDFKVVLTTFKEKTFGCSDYQCGDENGYCIDDDLQCDGVMNCLDGRDEFNCTHMSGTNEEPSIPAMIGGVVFMLLLCAGCGALIFFVCRRRRASQGTVIRTQPPVTFQQQQQQQPMMQNQQQPNYPTQPVYPAAQPAYGPAYGPAYPPSAPYAPPPQQQYYPPPPQAGYPPQPPAYDQQQQQPGPYAPPPPFNEKVNYNSNQENVQLP